MPRWLDYPAQVSELEKMARLAPVTRPAARPPPGLDSPDGAAPCLVCGARPARACRACGGVAYCDIAHQRADACWHDPVCPVLRDIAEDASMSERACREELVARLDRHPDRGADPRALTGWDDFLGPGPPLTPGQRRRFTAQMTRPLTLARALATLDIPARAGVLAIHVMGASRRELDVAPIAWAELVRLYPGTRFELALIGPDLQSATSARSQSTHPHLDLRVCPGLYRRALWRELGRPDLVIGYDCGLLVYPTWKPTILDLRGSGVPFVITSYRPWEIAAEARVLRAVKAMPLVEPHANPFASLAGERSSTIANDVAFDNAFVSAWH